MTIKAKPPSGRSLRLAATLISVAATLGACKTFDAPIMAAEPYPVDYRQRHPIAVTEADRSIVVFIGTGRGGMTAAQRADVMGMAQTWLREGTGGITIDMPTGTPNARAAHETLREIQAMIAAAHDHETAGDRRRGNDFAARPCLPQQVAIGCGKREQVPLGSTDDDHSVVRSDPTRQRPLGLNSPDLPTVVEAEDRAIPGSDVNRGAHYGRNEVHFSAFGWIDLGELAIFLGILYTTIGCTHLAIMIMDWTY